MTQEATRPEDTSSYFKGRDLVPESKMFVMPPHIAESLANTYIAAARELHRVEENRNTKAGLLQNAEKQAASARKRIAEGIESDSPTDTWLNSANVTKVAELEAAFRRARKDYEEAEVLFMEYTQKLEKAWEALVAAVG
jgi:hypothetical protein